MASNIEFMPPEVAQSFVGVDVDDYRVDAAVAAMFGTVERADAIVRSNGAFTRDDLVAILSRIYETRYTEFKTTEMFATNTSEIAPGATQYRIYRTGWGGDVTILDAGGNTTEVSPVSIQTDYEDAPVIYYASKAQWNALEELADALVVRGANARARKLEAARKVLERAFGKFGLFGLGDPSKFMGIIDNVYINLLLPSDPVKLGGSDAERLAMETLLLDNVSYATEVLQGHDAVEPNAIAMSPRMRNAFARTTRSADSDVSILDYVVGVTGIDPSKVYSDIQLQGIGAGGSDVILSFNDSAEYIELMEALPATPLPEERRGLHTNRLMLRGQGSTKVMEPLGVTRSDVTYTSSS